VEKLGGSQNGTRIRTRRIL